MRLIAGLLAALLWLGLLLCPLLAMLALAFGLDAALFGGQVLVTQWRLIAVTALVCALPMAVYLTERVRREFGLLNLYARLLRNPELGRRHQSV